VLRSEEHRLSSLCAQRSFTPLKAFLSQNKAESLEQNELKEEEDYMKMTFCVLVLAGLALLLGLAGCVAEPPVTTTTTTTTTRETVTTGPAQTVGREVLVTEAPPPVRVERRTVAPGTGYVWTNGYWRWTGVRYEWVPGSWIARPRMTAIWVEGRWERHSGGWAWVPGHWQ
jgi:hypothetical protein